MTQMYKNERSRRDKNVRNDTLEAAVKNYIPWWMCSKQKMEN